jgi:hypothetical protein
VRALVAVVMTVLLDALEVNPLTAPSPDRRSGTVCTGHQRDQSQVHAGRDQQCAAVRLGVGDRDPRRTVDQR